MNAVSHWFVFLSFIYLYTFMKEMNAWVCCYWDSHTGSNCCVCSFINGTYRMTQPVLRTNVTTFYSLMVTHYWLNENQVLFELFWDHNYLSKLQNPAPAMVFLTQWTHITFPKLMNVKCKSAKSQNKDHTTFICTMIFFAVCLSLIIRTFYPKALQQWNRVLDLWYWASKNKKSLALLRAPFILKALMEDWERARDGTQCLLQSLCPYSTALRNWALAIYACVCVC